MTSTTFAGKDNEGPVSFPGELLSPRTSSPLEGKFDRAPFVIGHSLHLNPLFRLPALIDLSQRLKRNVYFDTGDVGIDDRWDATRRDQTAEEALADLQNGKTWLVVKNAHQAPEYARVLDRCLAEAEKLVGFPFRNDIRNEEMIVFVTSPRRIATYHIDRECSFLLQIEGEKTIHIFDRNDRDLLPEEEIETFWTVDNNAPRYRAEFQDRAQSYVLKPGEAVHIPVNFPHWVENHDNVSVSVNINVQFRDSVRADVYRANYFLRRMGLKPAPPARSEIADRTKARLYSAARSAMHLCGKRLP
jgi:Cupin-like domain